MGLICVSDAHSRCSCGHDPKPSESSLLRSTSTRWDGREVAGKQFTAGVWHALALPFGRLIANPRLALETPCFGDLCT